MSYSQKIHFLNGNDPEFRKAIKGTDSEREEWEEDNGTFTDRPGAHLPDPHLYYEETDDEFGGFLIAVADIPKDATHIVIYTS